MVRKIFKFRKQGAGRAKIGVGSRLELGALWAEETLMIIMWGALGGFEEQRAGTARSHEEVRGRSGLDQTVGTS